MSLAVGLNMSVASGKRPRCSGRSQAGVVDTLHDDCALYRRIRVDPGCARTIARLSISPGSPCGFVGPESNSAPSNEGLIVMVSVSNTVSEGVCVVCHEPLYRHPSSLANRATTPPNVPGITYPRPFNSRLIPIAHLNATVRYLSLSELVNPHDRDAVHLYLVYFVHIGKLSLLVFSPFPRTVIAQIELGLFNFFERYPF